jgi:hypothetical protein
MAWAPSEQGQEKRQTSSLSYPYARDKVAFDGSKQVRECVLPRAGHLTPRTQHAVTTHDNNLTPQSPLPSAADRKGNSKLGFLSSVQDVKQFSTSLYLL